MTNEIERYDRPHLPVPTRDDIDYLEDQQRNIRGGMVLVVQKKIIAERELAKTEAAYRQADAALSELASKVRRKIERKHEVRPDERRDLDRLAAQKLLAEQQVKKYQKDCADLTEQVNTFERKRLELELEADQLRQDVQDIRRNDTILGAGQEVVRAEAEMRRLSNEARKIKRKQEDQLAGVKAELQVPQLSSSSIVTAAQRAVDQLLYPEDD